MISLWNEITECQELCELALEDAKKFGNEWATAEANYYTVKSRVAYSLKEDDKLPVSFINLVLKGHPEVARAMEKKDRAYVEYTNAKEAINVYKKRLDTLREEHSREWSQSGMRD